MSECSCAFIDNTSLLVINSKGTTVAVRTVQTGRRVIASATAFALMLGILFLGIAQWASPQAEAAKPQPVRLVQVLGKFDKFFWRNQNSDSELRLDFVMEAPAGRVKPNGSGLRLEYEYTGAYHGPVGTGINARQQGGGTWQNAGNLITTPNLGANDISQQYRIVRIDNFGPVDRITISMQGDLGNQFDRPSTLPGHAPYSLPVTMQAGVDISGNGNWQYFSYQYVATVFDATNSYGPDYLEVKPSANLGWDHIWGMFNAQSPWGYVVTEENPVVPKERMFVKFLSPWDINTQAKNANACTSVTSFYYQWYRSDGTPASGITEGPQVKDIKPTAYAERADNPRFGGSVIDLGADGGVDFTGEGPGYYRLVVWPQATNPTMANPEACTGHSYFTDSIGKLDHQNAFTVGSVFVLGGMGAANVIKNFEPNPMPFEESSEAVFKLDAGEGRVSGVGFVDTLPKNLYFTGKITKDTCGLQDQYITKAEVDAVGDPEIKANLSPGPVLQVSRDTLRVQGGVTYNIQTGEAYIVGPILPQDVTCEIRAEVHHTQAVTGNSTCSIKANADAQTNNSDNVSYHSMSTVLGYKPEQNPDPDKPKDFGECLDITMKSDIHPTPASARVMAGTDVPMSTTVTSEGPSKIDNATVKITAPTGTTFKQGPEGCTLDAPRKVATCSTGWMDPSDQRVYTFTVNVPSTVTGILKGSVESVYDFDTDTDNDKQPIEITVTTIDASKSSFTVSSDPIAADGKASGTITIEIKDTTGALLSGVADRLSAGLAQSDFSVAISAFKETSTPGVYQATITSTTVGDKHVQAKVDQTTLAPNGNSVAHFVPGDPVSFTFTIDNGNPIAANGVNSHVVWATAKDAQGNPVINAANEFSATAPDGVSISSFTETSPGSGIYTATVTSTVVGTHKVQGMFDGKAIGTVDAVFAAGGVSKEKSTWEVTPNTPRIANGSDAFTGVVTARDMNGNPVAGRTVTFTVPFGVHASSLSAVTDKDGKAIVTFTSSEVGTFPVSAHIDGPGSMGERTIEFVAGPMSTVASIFTVTPGSLGIDQKATATATIQDAWGHPIANQQVIFSVSGQAYFTDKNSCTTGEDGKCQVTIEDNEPEEVVVKAAVDGQGIKPTPGLTVTFFAYTPDPNNSVLKVTPNSQTVGSPVTATVTVRDSRGKPITGLTAKDVVVIGASQGLPDLIVSSFQETADGVYTYEMTSHLAGRFNVSAKVVGVTLKQTPDVRFWAGEVCVSRCTPVDPTHVTRFEMDRNDQMADGMAKDSAIAYAYDTFGNPVDMANVVVTDKTTGGLASTLNPREVSVRTDAEGKAVIQWSSHKAGTFTALGTINGLEPETAVLNQIRFTSGLADPISSELSVTPKSPIVVGNSYSAEVTVRDGKGNPVPDATVSFYLEPNSPANLSATFCETDQNGKCSVSVTSKVSTTVKVHATLPKDGVPTDLGGNFEEVKASPQTIRFDPDGICVTGCTPIDPTHVTHVVVTKDGAQADGVQTDEAQVYVYDRYGNPLPNKTIVVTPGSSDLNVGTVGATNSDGTSTIRFTSTVKGTYPATVSVDGQIVPTDPITLTFASGTGDASASTLTIDPVTSQSVGSTFTVTAHVNDTTGNPVSGAVVKFPAVEGVTYSSTTCTSTAQGTCEVEVTSKIAGVYVITGEIANKPIPTAVNAEFTAKGVCVTDCHPVDPTHVTRVEVTTDGSRADGQARDIVTAYAYDEYGNPVQGASLGSTPASNNLIVQQNPAPTGKDGTSTIWYASSVAGAHEADVTIDTVTPSGSPVTIRFGSGDGDTATSTWVISPKGPLTVGDGAANTYTATATVKDGKGNLVSGAVVRFAINPMGPSYSPSASCTTTDTGQCSVDVSSTKAGTYSVTASISAGPIMNDTTSGPSASVVWTPDEICTVIEGCEPIDPTLPDEKRSRLEVLVNDQPADGNGKNIVKVWAFDKWGNPIPGKLVQSDAPAGVTVQQGISPTGQDGSSTIWYTSLASGSHKVDVSVGGKAPAGSPATLNFRATDLDKDNSSFEVYITDSTSAVVADGTHSWTGKLTAKDNQGNPLSKLDTSDLVFGTAPDGVTVSSVSNDGNGVYTVTYTSTKAGDFTASVSYKSTSVGEAPIRFVPGPIDAGHSSVTVTPESQTVGAPATVVVTVRDANDNPIPGLTSADVKVMGSSQGLPDLTVTGFQETAPGVYTYSVTSKLVGTFTVSAKVSGTDVTQKPTVSFTQGGVCVANCTPVDPTHVTRFEMERNDQLADGQAKDSAIGYAYDNFGNPVAGAAVVVTDQTIGSLAGVLNPNQATATTDGNGTARIEWTSSKVGTYTAVGTIDGLPPLTAVLNQIRFVSGQADPSASELVVTPKSPITVGSSYNAEVTVRDTKGNPVPNATVSFRVDPNTPAHLTATVCETGTDGTCSVGLTSKLVGEFTIHATLPKNGVPTDVGGKDTSKASPQKVEFIADGICVTGCTPIDPTHVSRVEVTRDGARADGRQTDEATVYVYDRFGNPLSSVPAVVTPFSPDLKVGKVPATNGDGQAVIPFTSTVKGSFQASVNVGGILIPGSPKDPITLTFASGTADAKSSALTIKPTTSQVVDSAFTVTAHVRDDKGNNVDGAVVSFPAVPGLTFSSTTCASGTDGTCEVSVTSKIAGLYTISGEIAGTPIPVTVDARFTPKGVCVADCHPVDPTHVTRVEVTTDGRQADGKERDIATVYAYDENGNPVAGAQVQSAPQGDDLTVQPNVARTGEDGTTTIWYSSSVAGAHPADVTIDGATPNGSPVTVSFGSGSGDAATSTWTIAPVGPLTVGEDESSTYTATATIKDGKSNPVEGAVVSFRIDPNGPVFSSQSCTTNDKGQCTVQVSSTKSGTYSVTASISAGPIMNADTKGSSASVVWTADQVCADGCSPVDPNLPDEKRSRAEVVVDGQAADGNAKDQVKVWAFDKWGNPVPGQLVQSTPDNHVTVQQGIPATGEDGSSVIWYTSTTAGTYPVEVKVAGKTPMGSPLNLSFHPGPLSPANSLFSISPTTAGADEVIADGKDSWTGVFTARDKDLNLIPDLDSSKVVFTPDRGDVNVTEVTNNGDGTYTVRFTTTSANTPAKPHDEVELTYDGARVPDDHSVRTMSFVGGPVDASASSLTVDKATATTGDGEEGTITATATVTDQYGNPRGSVPVTFAVTGSAKLSALTAVTDEYGRASVTVTDAAAESVDISAAVIGKPITNSPIAVTFTATDLDPGTSTFEVFITDSTSSVVADGIHSWTGKLVAKDAQGNTLANLAASDMDFLVAPQGVTVSSVSNDGNGVYTVRYITTQAGSYTAKLSYKSTAVGEGQIRFTSGHVDAGLSTVSVNPESQTAGAPVTITVTVRDSNDNPIPGLTSEDVKVVGKGQGLPDLAVSGFQEVAAGVYTFEATSKQAGTFEVTATVAGVTLNQKPTVTFTAGAVCVANCTPVDPKNLTRFEMVRNDQLADGESKDSAVAYAFDGYGNPVAGAVVDVTDVTTNDLSGILSPNVHHVTTDDQGKATFEWSSTKAGTFTADGVIDGLRPATGILNQIRFTNGTADPMTSELVVTPDSPIVVGNAYTARVTVRDGQGNLVPKAVVSFYLDPDTPAQLSEKYCETGTDGTCSVSLTSKLAGEVAIHATLPKNGQPTDIAGDGDQVKASPRTVEFVAGRICVTNCTPIDPANTTRVEVVEDGAEANGSAQDLATVLVFDKFGNPVKDVSVESQSFASDMITNRIQPTGKDGSTLIEYRSTKSGSFTARVTMGHRVPDLALSMDGTATHDGSILLNFGSGTPDPSRSSLSISPSGSQVVGSAFTVIARLTDVNGNAVSGSSVSFSSGAGLEFSATGCVTNSSGVCTVEVTSKVVGTYTVTGRLGVTPIPNTVDAVFTPDTVCVADCTPVDPAHVTRVEMTTDGSQADGKQRDIATVYAYDRFGNPVPGAHVASAPSEGTALNVQSMVAPTGPDGTTTIWYTSSVAGTHRADVVIAGVAPATSPVTMSFGNGDGDPNHSTWSISPSGPLTAGSDADSSYHATATVLDATGNAVPGSVVTFRIDPLGPVFSPAGTCVTGSSGTCSVDVSSTKSGTYTVTAQIASGPITNSDTRGPAAWVAWKAGAVCSSAAGCDVDPSVPPENRTRVEVVVNDQAADGNAKDVVKVWAFDRLGNPVPNALVQSTTKDTALGIQSGIAPTGADGSSTVSYTSTQAGGHAAEVLLDYQVVTGSPVDVRFLAAPVITSPGDGGVTKDNPATVTGTGQNPGDTVSVSDGKDTVCTAVVQPDLSWSCDAPLADGDHKLSAVETTPGGGSSNPSGSVEVSVDTQAPGAPAITSPAPGASVNDNTPQVSGTAEPGSSVVVKDGDKVICSTTADKNGSWSCKPTEPLVDGDHTLTATAADPAGNTSTPSDPVTVEVDTIGPKVPSINTANGKEISGTAEPGSTVTVSYPKEDGTTGTVETSVGPDGTWSVTTPSDAVDGGISAVAKDEAGNTSDPGKGTLDTSTGPVKVGESNGSEVSGTAEPGSTVTVTDETGKTVPGCEAVKTDEQGVFVCTPDKPLAPGSSVTVTATDPAGNASKPVEVVVVTLTVEVAYFDRHAYDYQTVTGSHFNPGESVCLTVDPGLDAGCGIADGTGKVSITFQVPKGFGSGAHTVTMTGQKSGSVSTSFTVVGTVTIETGGKVSGDARGPYGVLAVLLAGAAGVGLGLTRAHPFSPRR